MFILDTANKFVSEYSYSPKQETAVIRVQARPTPNWHNISQNDGFETGFYRQ